MECLVTNKICPLNNLKCKECYLTNCKQTLKIIEEEEAMHRNDREEQLKKELSKKYPSCVVNGKICSLLEILDLNRGKVRCPYMINKRCAIK